MKKEVIDKFVHTIKAGKIKQPTNIGFKSESWLKQWKKLEDKASTRDHKVFMAGYILHTVLSEIRNKLDETYKNAPKITNEKLLLAYLALSNRELYVVRKAAIAKTKTCIHSVRLDSNPMENELTLGEVSHGCVDGLEPAIRMCHKRIEDNVAIEVSENPLDPLSFIRMECDLSQLYQLYTHVWQCIYLSDYEFICLDKEQDIFCVRQPKSDFELSYESSAIRRSRLGNQRMYKASNPTIQAQFLNDQFVVLQKKGKRKVASNIRIKNANSEMLVTNTYWQVTVEDMLKYYPKEWLVEEYENGFSIVEALSVMRCLMLMANELIDNFPQDDSFDNLNKLLQFCPTVQVASLKMALSKATEISHDKISKILAFLTFTSDKSSDLWCQPLVKKSKSEFAISVSALVAPIMTRLIEKWSVKLGIDLSKKGYTYEQTVIEMLNSQLAQNDFIQDFDPATGKRIRLANGEEEFDLLARLDDMIIVGEFKATLTSDSEVMKSRISETLVYAGVQVKRKIKFFQNNIELVFDRLGWKYDPKKKYKFSSCIVNSSQIFVGYLFEGVPVVDEIILKAYFESSIMSVLAVQEKDGDLRDIAWYELYSDFEQLKLNFQKYLNNPPQLNENSNSFDYSNVYLPAIDKNSFKFMQRRLVLKETKPEDKINQEHNFKLCKSADFEKQIGDIGLLL
ncbi:hypothetical protein [Pseudoalteromonas luteoviolacea]|uniref:hypothetical protein n=1 Tax=Pseudoalteromonas luteoviolacea TaxID=43657 RepID=UPI001B386879|nr:hypothetical protein [Pseudoalteromonas luteoviolacea]MBQ4840022.1 hypothetical protein [Pseudoalteromonas luteoviolacea]